MNVIYLFLILFMMFTKSSAAGTIAAGTTAAGTTAAGTIASGTTLTLAASCLPFGLLHFTLGDRDLSRP